jgi:ABC-type polysaccharide/polyol phosphate export permease
MGSGTFYVKAAMAEKLQQRTYAAQEARSLVGLLSGSYWSSQFRQDLADLGRFRHVLWNFVVTDLKVRYQRSTLGFLWTLLNPVMMMTVMALVFSEVMKWRIEDYAIYLFSGFIPWTFFASAIVTGSRCLLTNEFLIKKVQVPKYLFPLRCLLVAKVNLVFEIVALCILFLFLGATYRVQLVLVPAGIVMLGVFTLGIMLISMTLVSRYRDFEHIIGVFLQAWYFLSPILYTEKYVEGYPLVLALNPMVYILRFFHDAFYYVPSPHWPDPSTWLAAMGVSVGTFLVGYVVYKRCEPHYVFWL